MREDVYDGDFAVVPGGAGSAPLITGTIALGGVEQPPLLGRDSSSLTLSECATCPEFWLLWCSIAASSGAAMALVNNMDAIAASAGVGDGAAAGMVSLFSVCNCVGRLCGGLASGGRFTSAPLRDPPRCASRRRWWRWRVRCASRRFEEAFSRPFRSSDSRWARTRVGAVGREGAKHAGAVYGGLSVAPLIGSYA